MYKQKKALSLIAILLLSVSIEAKINIPASVEKQELCQEIYKKMTNEHFFNDKNLGSINSEIFDALLDQLDSQKIYFTKSEIKSYKRKFSKFDNPISYQKKYLKPSLCSIDLKSNFAFINLYFNRLIEATNYQLKEVTKQNFDFTKDEFIIIDDDQQKWQQSKLELQKIWRRLAKNDVLTSMLAEKETEEAIETIEKRYKNRLRRISQRNEEDVFSIAMNNLTSYFDPHSSYFSPKSAEDFEMTMSLKLEGIGALLTTEDDYPTIVSVVPGGPAEKTGKIHPDDKIVKISQVEELNSTPTDVVGWRIDEVVQLIRGKAGTKVELELIPGKTEDLSERKFVTITREEVKLEEQAAKSRVIEMKRNMQTIKIGIVELPTFYIDFNAWRNRDPNFRSSSKDVENILKKFNDQEVDAVLIDLRGNSGGSLFEANKLTGLFVSSGATLQVKESNGTIRPWGDARAKQIWKKPLAVMVDRYSASASEIFAGAIQDYQRGIIIGQKTFGKGTVQKLDSLSSGQIKITESKFYRITGAGMQSKGIHPDITLPSTWDIEEIGESSYSTALPWDEIKPIRFQKFSMGTSLISQLYDEHLIRVSQSPNLQYILDIRKRYEIQKNKEAVSLNLTNRRLEKEERQLWALDIENKRRASLNLEIFNSYKAMEDYNNAKETADDKKDFEINIDDDYLLNEGAQILSDYMLFNQNIYLPQAA
ncbi:carboxy terminal-processing peptidase [Gammaproteobacteria bacterium]|nr:carboxy terminal-processing peptidase [Gammaproteobacteria bacterium]